MRIGLANIYSYRPHVEHLYFLSKLLQEAGHEVFFLTCDSSVASCYSRQIKGSGRLKECSKCILGGVRSFPVATVTSISSSYVTAKLDESMLDELALSSSCTLNRTETDDEWNAPEVIATRKSLHKPISSVFQSTVQWVEKNQLDGIICFNGRMDLTRAVTYACDRAGIPFITHERTWFGHGLHLTPNENCLSLAGINNMAEEYQNKPLKVAQARLAGKLIGERFIQRNSLEWRLYNKSPEPTAWPLNSEGPRVLILPSSKNEFAGHPEWECGWQDNTVALDDFFAAFSIKPEQVVLRCHPNWGESIGKVGGNRALHLYREWSQKRGIYFISSEKKASTYDLIQQADIVVLNGGSSAVEAGVCGKQVICLGPAMYNKAGFVRVFCNREELYRDGALQPIDSDTVIRKTLRFLYMAANRFPQFVRNVRAIETTRYQYFSGADANRLLSMLKTGVIEPDDVTHAETTEWEDSIINKFKNKEWSQLADYQEPASNLPLLNINRRFGFRWIDTVRAKFPLGDRE